MHKTVVIADDEPITIMDVREILAGAGFDVLGTASDGFDAVELCRRFKPDIVLLDIKMPLLDGLKAAKIISGEGIAKSVLLLTAYSDKEFIEQAKQAGVMGYIVKPFDERSLLPAVEIALHKGLEIDKIKEDAKAAAEKLEDRKYIEKAKGILMKSFKISEDEAYLRIRKLSMDKRCGMRQIADAIIMNNQSGME